MQSRQIQRRFRYTAALGLLATAGIGADAQATHATPAPFIAVDWGTSPDSLIARAAASGWAYSHVDEDGDYAFRGRIGLVNAMAFATFGRSGGLIRLLVSVAPHPFAPATYRELSDTLRSHHGRAALGEDEQDAVARPAPAMAAAAAWPGILMGLRRDGWIMMVFTCPESSPKLPAGRMVGAVS